MDIEQVSTSNIRTAQRGRGDGLMDKYSLLLDGVQLSAIELLSLGTAADE